MNGAASFFPIYKDRMDTEKYILLGKTQDELKQWLKAQSLPAFMSSQLMDWIYVKRVRSFDEMTNISLKHRAFLKEHASLGLVDPVACAVSKDGTKKYLFATASGIGIEAVYIPDRDRATLCVSSQVGCKMHCAFCMTGRMGYKASLAAHEILNQVLSIEDSTSLTNLVFMGMGEPCDNIEAVLIAIRLLTDEKAFAWSPKRITLSSIGLLPGLKRVLEETSVHIAISLHSPDALQRKEWIPAQKAYPISDILQTLKAYDFSHQRRLSFEYIMFDGMNDSLAHARKLLSLLNGLKCRMNLIRFHRIPDSPFAPSSEETIQAFADFLNARDLQTTVRASRGEDIQAACGLLSTTAKN